MPTLAVGMLGTAENHHMPTASVGMAPGDPGPECWGGPASPALLQGLMERLATVEARADDALPALLADALPRIAAGAEIVVVSTRPVDLADTTRFAAVWSDPVAARACAADPVHRYVKQRLAPNS